MESLGRDGDRVLKRSNGGAQAPQIFTGLAAPSGALTQRYTGIISLQPATVAPPLGHLLQQATKATSSLPPWTSGWEGNRMWRFMWMRSIRSIGIAPWSVDLLLIFSTGSCCCSCCSCCSCCPRLLSFAVSSRSSSLFLFLFPPAKE